MVKQAQFMLLHSFSGDDEDVVICATIANDVAAVLLSVLKKTRRYRCDHGGDDVGIMRC